MKNPFLAKEEHFDALVAKLSPNLSDLYHSMKHTRAEPSYRGRTFVVYKMDGRSAQVLDTVEVLDYECNDLTGASTEIVSQTTGKVIEVGYQPVQLFDFPVLVWLPLASRTRWCADAQTAGNGGSLAFDLVVRVVSHHHARERGVTHCETGPAYAAEFESLTAV